MTVNVENVLKVADAIEQHSIPDLGFNMLDYVHEVDPNNGYDVKYYGDRSGHSCGTVACIAGWARRIRTGQPLAPEAGYLFDWRTEARWLGLSPRVGGSGALLFLGDDDTNERLDKVTTAEAVAVLRHLAKTGKVDWTVAIAAATP